MEFREKLDKLKVHATYIDEISTNYNIGLITVNEYMGQLEDVVIAYNKNKQALQQEYDLSETAISLMLINIH